MKDLKKIDKELLVIVIIFSLFGLIMIFSASSASTILRYNTGSMHFMKKQAEALLVGLFAGIIILFFPTKKYKVLSYLAFVGITAFLLLVLIYGKINHNAQSWFKIGPFSIQPSEFAKTVIVLFMAVFYNNLAVLKSNKLAIYLLPVCLSGILILLVILQQDLGTALIILAMTIMIFLSVPFIKKNIKQVLKIGAVGVVILAAGLIVVGDKILTPERMSRFKFMNPCTRYQEDTGYQVCNGFIAIANGGLFGAGLGNSTQKYLYLPESHTDFIFPIICEELGSIVGIVIILLYGLILFRILKISKEADNLRNKILAYGAFCYFTLHILINILGVLALMPLTGVPLPFLSYGGSYTLNAVIMIFIVERVSIENKKNKIARELSSM